MHNNERTDDPYNQSCPEFQRGRCARNYTPAARICAMLILRSAPRVHSTPATRESAHVDPLQSARPRPWAAPGGPIAASSTKCAQPRIIYKHRTSTDRGRLTATIPRAMNPRNLLGPRRSTISNSTHCPRRACPASAAIRPRRPRDLGAAAAPDERVQPPGAASRGPHADPCTRSSPPPEASRAGQGRQIGTFTASEVLC